MATDKDLETLLDERMKLQDHERTQDSQTQNADKVAASAPLPPGMQKNQDTTTEDLWKELNRTPLFMTSLDETGDGESGENVALEALKALAYEGTRAEVAQNFREQGTELVRTEKRYPEARDYYTKALDALKRPPLPPDPEQGPQVVEIDEEAEERKERAIEEACLVNRALCNLEMTNYYAEENYGSCNRDCAAALRLNPRNVKAWYRAASACLALDKIPEALDACQSGLKYDSHNAALKKLTTKIENRQAHLAEMDRVRRERHERQRLEQATLRLALKNRNVLTRKTDRPPEMPEAKIALEDPVDASSNLSFPVIILYPVHAQTDFIKEFREDESLTDHLSYIFPLPWDEKKEYSLSTVECFMETVESGLIKAGKKLSLLKLLGSGKLEVVDGLVRISVVPKDQTAQWIEDFKKRRGKQ
ncbi:HSP70/90 co-chaperone [Saxophila tyrrhenica]|uniref:HSP70/90 co-chaperone n=1 Tax=Saxophila tyrrhenica TaxID=1690608 RepID=A0AAV9P7D2_9PEZI|nr:HSP70/90 co-chaperone [Saxophila tyrrhenica]